MLEPLPCIPGTATDKSCSDGVSPNMPIEDYIGYIYKFAIAIAAFLAIIMIVWGGFEYMTTDSIGSKNDAKEKFKNAATGLLMVLASYLILQTIDPRLVTINTSIPALPQSPNYLSGLVAESSSLQADLSAMTTTAIQKSAEISKQIKEKQDQTALLIQKYLDQTITPDQIDQLYKLEQEIADLTGQQAETIAHGTAVNQLKTILSPISGQVTKDSIDLINKNYDAVINSLDPQRNAERIFTLKAEKSSLDIEIENQRQTETDTYFFVNNNAAGVGNSKDEIKKMQDNLKSDQDQYDRVVANNALDPIFKEAYADIIKSKISLEKNALKL